MEGRLKNGVIYDQVSSLIDISIDLIILLTELKIKGQLNIYEYTEHVYVKAMFLSEVMGIDSNL